MTAARVEVGTRADGSMFIESYCGQCGHVEGCEKCRQLGTAMAELLGAVSESMGTPVEVSERGFRSADDAFGEPS